MSRMWLTFLCWYILAKCIFQESLSPRLILDVSFTRRKSFLFHFKLVDMKSNVVFPEDVIYMLQISTKTFICIYFWEELCRIEIRNRVCNSVKRWRHRYLVCLESSEQCNKLSFQCSRNIENSEAFSNELEKTKLCVSSSKGWEN